MYTLAEFQPDMPVTLGVMVLQSDKATTIGNYVSGP